MAIFDINNPPSSPDSSFDSDTSLEVILTIQGGVRQKVAPGDWVDVDSSIVSQDPIWGYSFQVMNVYEEAQAADIMMFDAGSDSYFVTQLSASAITGNFRHVPSEA